MKTFVLTILLAFSLAGADRGLLPDPIRYPGVTNPAVTQENIHRTICVSGWTKTIRPPTSYTNKLKAVQMKQEDLSGTPREYEEDHLIPLQLGGHPTDPGNLWPEPWPAARKKDVVETRLKRWVCSGKVPLAAAQEAIAMDWTDVKLPGTDDKLYISDETGALLYPKGGIGLGTPWPESRVQATKTTTDSLGVNFFSPNPCTEPHPVNVGQNGSIKDVCSNEEIARVNKDGSTTGDTAKALRVLLRALASSWNTDLWN
jgi:hypothetical protein